MAGARFPIGRELSRWVKALGHQEHPPSITAHHWPGVAGRTCDGWPPTATRICALLLHPLIGPRPLPLQFLDGAPGCGASLVIRLEQLVRAERFSMSAAAGQMSRSGIVAATAHVN
jgi:hypothetical protein